MTGGNSPLDAFQLVSKNDGAVEVASSSLFQDSPPAMSGETIEYKLIVSNPQGFHLRPMAAFAEVANRFQSNVTVSKEDKHVNGKSPLELMFLAAEQGSELTVRVTGPDAADALKALVNLMATMTAEQENPEEPPLPRKG
jgi:phosphocarrier protein HPr